MPNPLPGASVHLPHLHPTKRARTGQKLSIGTPRHTKDQGVNVVGVLQGLYASACGRVPYPDGIVPPATGQHLPIGAPRHPLPNPAMPAQHSGERLTLHIPHSHECIGSCTGDSFAIGTPGDIVERDRIALQPGYTQPTLDVPEPQGAIVTATGQVATVRGESDRVHTRPLPIHAPPIPAPVTAPR